MLEFTLKFLSGDSRKYEVDEAVWPISMCPVPIDLMSF